MPPHCHEAPHDRPLPDNELFVFLPFFPSLALESVTILTKEFNKTQLNHLIKGLTPFPDPFSVEKWHQIIDDPTLADAILDRVVRNAYKLQLKGESVRKKRSKLSNSKQGLIKNGELLTVFHLL